MKTEAEMEVMQSCKPRNIWGYQKQEEARKDSSLEVSEGVWPYHHWTSSLQNCETVLDTSLEASG